MVSKDKTKEYVLLSYGIKVLDYIKTLLEARLKELENESGSDMQLVQEDI